MNTYDDWVRAGCPPLPETTAHTGRPASESREGNPGAVIAATRPLAEAMWASRDDWDDDEWEDDDDEQPG